MLTEPEQINYRNHDEALALLESQYSYKSDDVYFFNVHRTKVLVRLLQKRHDYFNSSLIPALVSHALPDERIEDSFVSQKKGTGHVIVFVKTKSDRDLVLRTNLFIDEPEQYMDLEHTFIAMFHSVGIPTATLLFSDTSRKKFPFDYQVMEVLPGENLGDEWAGTEEEYNKITVNFGRNVAKCYRLPLQGWGRIHKNVDGELIGTYKSHHEFLTAYLEHDLEVLELFGFLDKKGKQQVSAYFDSVEIGDLFLDMTQGYLLHNDPSDLNIQAKDGTIVAMFDWENAVVFDPICELGTAPTWSSKYKKNQELMVQGFVDELGYEPLNLHKKMAVYFMRKMIDKVQFALRGERLQQKHIELFKKGLEQLGLEIPIRIKL